MWILFAFGSAFFAGITAILAKCGIRNTDSNVATALRTIVVTIIFSYFVLKEKLNAKSAVGLLLIVAGTLALLL